MYGFPKMNPLQTKCLLVSVRHGVRLLVKRHYPVLDA